jgi:VCBS repeat-containing protein
MLRRSWIPAVIRQAVARRPNRKRVRAIRNLQLLEERTVPTGNTIGTADEVFPTALAFGTPNPTSNTTDAIVTVTIGIPIDVDMFKAYYNAGDYFWGDVDARVTDNGGQISSIDSYLRIFKPTNDPNDHPEARYEWANNDGVDPDTGVSSHDSALNGLRAPESGYYYFGISSVDNTIYNPFTGANRQNSRSGPAATGTFRIQISRVLNAAPSANPLTLNILEDAAVSAVLTGSDPNGDTLKDFTIVSGPTHGAITSFSPATGQFTYVPNANFYGTDTFTFRLFDAYNAVSNTATVTINVAPVNDRPSFTPGSNPEVLEDSGTKTIANWATNISTGPNDGTQTLSFVIQGNTNPGLFQTQPAISSNGTLTFQPAANAHGTAQMTVYLTDDGGTANGGLNTSHPPHTLTITVKPVNDAPSFTMGSNKTVAEDAALQTIANWATNISRGPSNESGQSVWFEVVNNNNSLFETQPSVSSTGTLTFKPAADQFGTATVSVRLRDNGGTADGGVDASHVNPSSNWPTFTITVDSVNDKPKPKDDEATTDEDNAVTIDVVANDSPGPSNESTQTVSVISVGTPSYGTAAIVNGKVVYTPNANYHGGDSFTYTIRDSGSPPEEASANGTITINPINDRPVALNGSATVAEDANPGVTINLRDLVSDVETSDANLTYEIVNGPPAAEGTLSTTADAGIDTFKPAANFHGTSRFTYRVRDTGDPPGSPNELWSEIREVVVTVTAVNDAPTADNDSYQVDEGAALDVLAPGVLDGDADIDQQTLTAKILTLPAYGTLTLNDDGSFSYVHNGSETTSDSFTYRAFDGTAYSEPATVTITINPVNDAPVAVDDAYSIAEDGTLNVAAAGLVANDTDVDSTTLTVATPRPVQGPSNGTLTVNANGSFSYQPAANFNGEDSFTYRVYDGAKASELTATVRITVTPVNDAPNTSAGNAPVNEDGTVMLDLRTLVSDVETIDDNLTFTVGGATNGVVQLQPDGHTALFTPTTNFNGAASFTYTVKDTGDGSSAAITTGAVTVSVPVAPVNDEPDVLSTSLTTNEDTAVDIDLWTLVKDVETANANLTFAVGDATNGTVSLLSDGHTARFSPTANVNGAASFTYTVKDTADGASPAITTGATTIAVTVTPVNDAPVANSESLTTAEDAAVDIDLRSLVNDVETADANLTFAVGGASNGTVSLLADGHTARFTPAANFSGPASFTYTAKDTGDGASAAITTSATTISITVTPVNDAPVPTTGSLTTNEDAAVDIDLWTLVSDVETADSALTFAVGGATNGAVALLADGHTARFTPNTNYNGAASFTYTAKDTGDGASAAITTSSTTVSVTVNNLVDLSGRVFDDRDNDGAFEPADGDAGRGGVTVQVWNQALTTLLAQTGTAADGTYRLDANLTPGNYKVVEAFNESAAGLLDGRETAGALAGTVDNTKDSNTIGVTVAAGDADAGGYNFAEIQPSRIQGLVWIDFNNDAELNFGERAVEGATLTLTGTDDRGTSVNRTMTTDAQGIAEFLNLRPGTYSLAETQPANLNDGLDTLGTVNGVVTGTASNDRFDQIVLANPMSDAVNYNFGERPANGDQVQSGQTASIAYWQNNKGQQLLLALNGGASSTQLGNWLAATFPNLYGAGAGPNNLAGKTNAQVAALYVTLFKRTGQSLPNSGPPKLDAQVMSTALSVYVTNQTLADTTAVAFGFTVSASGLGASTFNVATSGAAVGVQDGTVMTVMDILLAVNTRTVIGVLYDLNGDGLISDTEKQLRQKAHDLFAALNG